VTRLWWLQIRYCGMNATFHNEAGWVTLGHQKRSPEQQALKLMSTINTLTHNCQHGYIYRVRGSCNMHSRLQRNMSRYWWINSRFYCFDLLTRLALLTVEACQASFHFHISNFVVHIQSVHQPTSAPGSAFFLLVVLFKNQVNLQ
jgi:hypothetical protein